MKRLTTIAVLVLLSLAVLGVVSILGELQASATMAETRPAISIDWQTGLPHAPDVVEAELVEDGRRLLLVPTAKTIFVIDGRDVTELAPACCYDNGAFTLFGNDQRRKRVWLFAVLAEGKPSVQVAPAK